MVDLHVRQAIMEQMRPRAQIKSTQVQAAVLVILASCSSEPTLEPPIREKEWVQRASRSQEDERVPNPPRGKTELEEEEDRIKGTLVPNFGQSEAALKMAAEASRGQGQLDILRDYKLQNPTPRPPDTPAAHPKYTDRDQERRSIRNEIDRLYSISKVIREKDDSVCHSKAEEVVALWRRAALLKPIDDKLLSAINKLRLCTSICGDCSDVERYLRDSK